jgi:hypothetical protein
MLGGPVGAAIGGLAGSAVAGFTGSVIEQAGSGSPFCLSCALIAAGVSVAMDAALLGLGRIPGVKQLAKGIGSKLAGVGKKIGGFFSRLWGRAKDKVRSWRSTGGRAAATSGAARFLTQSITKARNALSRATQARNNLPKNSQWRDKTVASDGKRTVSGWADPPSGFSHAAPEQVAAQSKKMGHNLASAGGNDQVKLGGFKGKYQASHAEKQLSMLCPDEPIGVSKPMCNDCQNYFSKLARDRGKPQVVADPEVTRIFRPDGSVGVVDKNGAVSLVPSGGGTPIPTTLEAISG